MSSAQPIPWYLYPISMSFGALEGNGVSTEKGVDLRVPYHTPITPLFPGTVRSVATGPYGQEVDVIGMLNGQQVTASYVHLDEALVSPGQAVGLGTELGVSGGQNQGGFHPASPAYSSYPHIEFSLWPGGSTPYAGQPYDPMAFINAVQASQGADLQPIQPNAPSSTPPSASLLASLGANLSGLFPTGPTTGGATTAILQAPNLSGDIASGVAGGISGGASGIGATILQALGVARLTDLLWRVGLLVVALVLIIVVASALTAKATQNVVEGVANSKPAQTVRQVAPFVK